MNRTAGAVVVLIALVALAEGVLRGSVTVQTDSSSIPEPTEGGGGVVYVRTRLEGWRWSEWNLSRGIVGWAWGSWHRTSASSEATARVW
jgi:hypothetical protein